MSRLRDAGTQVFRTDLQGDIICVSDGNELTFAVEKNADYESIWQGADSYVPVLPPAYEEAEKPDSSAEVYIGNKNSKKFHYASCSSVKNMKEKNKVELNTREEATVAKQGVSSVFADNTVCIVQAVDQVGHLR